MEYKEVEFNKMFKQDIKDESIQYMFRVSILRTEAASHVPFITDEIKKSLPNFDIKDYRNEYRNGQIHLDTIIFKSGMNSDEGIDFMIDRCSLTHIRYNTLNEKFQDGKEMNLFELFELLDVNLYFLFVTEMYNSNLLYRKVAKQENLDFKENHDELYALSTMVNQILIYNKMRNYIFEDGTTCYSEKDCEEFITGLLDNADKNDLKVFERSIDVAYNLELLDSEGKNYLTECINMRKNIS